MCHKFSFCRTNITDANRYSLENVLLSFFPCILPLSPFSAFLLHPASPHRFHPLRPPLSSIIPLLSARIREGRRKVLFSRRGVFHFHPRVPPFRPPLAFLRFFACRLNFTSAYPRESSSQREVEKVKAKWKSAMLSSYSLKSSVKFIECSRFASK